MLKNLSQIIEKLIKHYDPEKIILYGSYGTKSEMEDSDIDLLIIKDTDKRFVERQIEVEKILAEREVAIDVIVYTPQEIRYLFSIGSPFIEEVMEKGRLVYMRKATKSWLKDAKDELDSALILYEHKKYRAACYHSQQCVEKGLKALVLEKGQRPVRIHDIVKLLNEVKRIGWDVKLIMDDAIFLNSIYRGRYPTEEGLLPYGEPTAEDAKRAVSIAKEFINKLSNLLK